jgi:hypothetical protein
LHTQDSVDPFPFESVSVRGHPTPFLTSRQHFEWLQRHTKERSTWTGERGALDLIYRPVPSEAKNPVGHPMSSLRCRGN